MNIVDLIIIVTAAWYGISGYIRGFLFSAITITGSALALVVAVVLHRPSAKTWASAVDSDIIETMYLNVDLHALAEIGYSNSVIETWYLYNSENREAIPVQASDAQEVLTTNQINIGEVIEFFFANVVIFIVTYLICYKLYMIISNSLLENKLTSFLILPQRISRLLGTLMGLVQGGLVITVVLLIINLLIPLGIPMNAVMEMNNSYLNTAVIDFINNILY